MNHAKNLDGNLAALSAYEAQQDKLEVTQRELEAAQVRALVAGLDGTEGLDLAGESLGQHATKDYKELRDFLQRSLSHYDNVTRAFEDMDYVALGRLTLALIRPYLTDYAEKNAEEYLPSVDGPERED